MCHQNESCLIEISGEPRASSTIAEKRTQTAREGERGVKSATAHELRGVTRGRGFTTCNYIT